MNASHETPLEQEHTKLSTPGESTEKQKKAEPSCNVTQTFSNEQVIKRQS